MVGSWVINVRNGRGYTISGKLRCVELVAAIIAAGYEFPTDCVSSSLPNPAFSSHKITRILMERCREQPFSHNVTDRLIGECAAIVLSEPLCALTKGRVLTLCQSDPGKYS